MSQPSVQAAVVYEPAVRPDGGRLQPIYWETDDGSILGPAAPDIFRRQGDAFWIVVTFEGQPQRIPADQLRSKRDFERQSTSQVVNPMRKAG